MSPSLSIDPLRYEDYAPPLYYLLAAPIYALTEGWITAIRLFSVSSAERWWWWPISSARKCIPINCLGARRRGVCGVCAAASGNDVGGQQ